jgi:methionine-rich copper-binding protein CopC
MRHRLIGLAGLTMSAALLVNSPAWAHAHLVNSNPVAGATVKTAPKTIVLTFSNKVVPAFSKFEVTMPEHGGMKIPVRTTISTDGKSIIGTPQTALASGAYIIVYTAAAADGHKMAGEVAFKVD